MIITKKKTNIQEKVKEAFELIKQGVAQITTSKDYRAFLAFSSRFYQRSLNNQLLIWVQKPTATYVAGFKEWQKMGRYVKKGEKGIKILAPMHIRKIQENENEEEETINYIRYKTVSVFDISQTEGKPIPSLKDFVKTVQGETELYEMVRDISPFPVEELDYCNGADGYFIHKKQEIKILSSNPSKHRLLTLIHEIAHGLLHIDRKNIPSIEIREIEAESVGFVVCHALGIDSSMNSLGYLTSYGGEHTCELVEDSKERINLASREILTLFESKYLIGDKSKESLNS
ncbi:ArdC-like ssDNA-binding domain-containing protein [Sutcliffiella cohnii]